MRFSFRPQLDKSDCGVACLSMIATYYGLHVDIEYIRNVCGINKQGVSLLAICEAAESLGFKTIGGKISLQQLIDNAPLPCILHWNQNHFVVLYKIRKNRLSKKKYIFYIADPAKGLLIYNEAELKKHWISTQNQNEPQGVVLLFQKTSDFNPSSYNKKLTFSYLKQYILQFKKFFFQLSISFILVGIIQFLFPYFTQAIVDVGINTKNINIIYIILIAQLVLTFSRFMVDYLRQWLLLYIGVRVSLSLMSQFITKLLKAPMSFFDTRQTGDLIQRMDDHQRLESFLTNKLFDFIFNIFYFIIYLVILFTFNLKIVSLFLIFSLLQTFWILIFLKKRRQIDYQLFELNSKNNTLTYQILQSVHEIKIQQCEKAKRWEWEDIQAEMFQTYIHSLKLNQNQNLGIFLLNESKNIFITIISATMVVSGQLSLGSMLAIQYIIGQLSLPIDQIISFIQSFQDTKISLERINQIYQIEDENKNKLNLPKKIANKTIYINNLYFRYPGTYRNVLENLSLIIPQNKVTAIVGSSGSGKTTLIKMLLQYYSPLKGEILLENHSLNSLNSDWWRSKIGTVMQDGYIFYDSIAKNISAYDEPINTVKLIESAKKAALLDYIEQLPLGFNTIVGNDGINLSQGQKQRLLIARAIYKNPEYMFLDEATNALDANNEKEIMNNLQEFFKDRTVVIVAHRLSTVKNADQIVVLEKGKIVEQGNHKVLIQKRGKYYELVKNQLELGSD